MKKISDILTDARDIIRERGWSRGTYVNSNTGAVCSLGAIYFACGYMEPAVLELEGGVRDFAFNVTDSDDLEAIRHQGEEAARLLCGVTGSDWLPRWNDYVAVDQHHVEATFADAIAKAKEQGR